MENMRPIRVPQEEIEAYGIYEPLAVGTYPRHIMMPKTAEAKEPFAIQPSQLDTNHHVNNREYIRMAMAYLPAGFVCRELLVDYHAQAVAGDVIYPRAAVTEAGMMVSLENAAGKAFSVVEFRG